jgi:hypothetical protein
MRGAVSGMVAVPTTGLKLFIQSLERFVRKVYKKVLTTIKEV